ncbi:hypothetical protein [Streptomyces resistomycificus]|uniref:Lipoprotein n=1 Tax=Streptomyces resistomycificus TaxID=67356 RepID=A0A0L8KZG5_9ACTN|nr:hypothetical protein [Streptomyces resistomycificus]KOG31368.1 hypothetical protein ADK37_30850 [Streptomyces resistomycificus]KUN94279.1 hypothetical protein AQJ84_26670 [Streptomyces resistomycificus]
MPTTARRPFLGATALTVVLTAVSGCSSDSGQGDGDSRVLQALGTLADDNAADEVTYLDAEKTRALSKGDEKRFSAVGQPGGSPLNAYEPGPWGQSLNVAQIDTAVDTKSAGRWEGSFDAAAITASLKSNGYRQRGDDRTWTPADGKGVSLQVTKDEIAYSAHGDTAMAAVTPKQGASLADKEEYRRAVGCLGDVYRADFLALTATKPVRLSALGQQADSVAENTEVLCLVVKDEATADRAAAKLRAVVADESPKFDGTKVTVEKGDAPLVRAVVPDTAAQRPGRLVRSDLELWMVITDL